MKLQNTLDLSTFEITRFRIWNHTSNPDDYGIGTKYFNTNSGHEAYNREVIYTGTGWRTAAYMDDLTTFKDEDFNALKEKVELLSGDVDTDAIINNMKDVEAFLEGFTESQTLMDLLNSKFDKTGGTITGNSNIPLTINQTGDGNTWIKFANIYNTLGYIGFSPSAGLAIMPSDGSKVYSVIHSGNIGDYKAGDADKLGGIDSSLYALLDTTRYKENTNADSLTRVGFYINQTAQGTGNENFPDGYGKLFSWGGSYAYVQMYASVLGNNKLYYRSQASNLSGSTWKTIAFTDSDITGNAATATKLQDDTAYTIWGRTFFENGKPKDVSSSPILNNNSGLYFKNAAGNANKLLFYFDTAEQLHIGGDSATDKNATHIYGNPTYFKSSNTGQPLMTITEDGQVLIGTDVQPSVGECLLYLNKRGHFGTAISSYTLGRAPRYGLTVGNVNEYGLYLYTTANQQSNIQATRFDSDATARALNLNPLGGAVNIASADANTNVLGHLFASKDLYMSGFLMMKHGGEGIYIAGTSLSWHNTNNAWSASLLTFAKDSIKFHQLADFTSRVLIGGAEDDGSYRLQVLGGIKSYSPEGHAARLNNGNVSLSLIGSSTTTSVAKGLYFNFDNTYVGGLVAYHSRGTFQYLYLGDDTTAPWFSINSTESNFNVLTKFSNRVLIGGAVDESVFTLNVKGASRLETLYTYGNVFNFSSDKTSRLTTAWADDIVRIYANNIEGSVSRDIYLGSYNGAGLNIIGGGRVLIGTKNDDESGATLQVAGLSAFKGGALIPSGQKLTIGSVTFEEVATGEIEVNGNLHTTGTLASGGKAEEGTGSTGGASGTIREFTIDPPTDNTSSFKLEHSFNTEKVIVQIFELNGNSGKYEMILTDVEITDANNVTVTFGRKPTEYHKVYVMA